MRAILLETKLRPPKLPARRIARPRLTERLEEGFESGRPITLISAPAGFGKTTAALEWLERTRAPRAWLSLDAEDDDPGRFFLYLIAALQGVHDGIGRDVAEILRSGQVPPSDILCASLVNDLLDCDDRFILVLDDFQAVQDGAILRVFETLAANPPPALQQLC